MARWSLHLTRVSHGRKHETSSWQGLILNPNFSSSFAFGINHAKSAVKDSLTNDCHYQFRSHPLASNLYGSYYPIYRFSRNLSQQISTRGLILIVSGRVYSLGGRPGAYCNNKILGYLKVFFGVTFPFRSVPPGSWRWIFRDSRDSWITSLPQWTTYRNATAAYKDDKSREKRCWWPRRIL